MTRDEFLTKAMVACWHDNHEFHQTEDDCRTYYMKCSKCGAWPMGFPDPTPEYDDAVGFVTLLLWSQDDARVYVPQGGPGKWTWAEFLQYAYRKNQGGKDYSALWSDFIRWLFNPERFAGILAEYLGWREE